MKEKKSSIQRCVSCSNIRCLAMRAMLRYPVFNDACYVQLTCVQRCVSCSLLPADNGTLHFWDWKTGYNFQRVQAAVQPGSIDSEAGIFVLRFDKSGSRLITGEADKTIKIYREDDSAVGVHAQCPVCALHVWPVYL